MTNNIDDADLIEAINGDDENVSLDALAQLSARHCGTNNFKAANVIARIVRDPSRSDLLRLMAYIDLLLVSNKPVNEYPPPSKLRFPGIVDWRFVDSMIESG